MRTIYLDSCIVIYLIEGDEPWRGWVRAAFSPPRLKGRITAYSDLTRLEARLGPKRNPNPVVLEKFDAFFATPGFRRVPIDTGVYDFATDLRADHKIKTPDALHLAAALRAGCDEFWTNDLRLESAAAGRIRLVTPDGLGG
ncbi:type II toxin-antitoxin system VapC family toxin [Methylomagnum sp.]